MTLSDATAVRIEIIVHEQKVMNSTKKRLHQPSISITGFAITNQLSMVMTWKSEKKEVRTSEKKVLTSSAFSGSSLWPRSCVMPMDTKRLKPNSTKITKKNGPSIIVIASRKAANLLTILNTRKSRSNLSNLRKRRTTEPLDTSSTWPSSPQALKTFAAYTSKGASQRSTTPNKTMTVSRMFHTLSFLLVRKPITPRFPTRSTSSARKMQRKELSKTGHMGHPG
mmetsp:Transcript_92700/g.276462  ORF Transcript_92700/g.276462 Transcript_92700/m.276462 type:complete len:224 (-) Transcript_92700:320-991(-)